MVRGFESLGAAWNVVEAPDKWRSPLVVSKHSKKEGKGETVSGRKTHGKGKECFLFYPAPTKNPGPIF